MSAKPVRMEKCEPEFGVRSKVDVGPVAKDNCINQASIDANKHTQQQTPTAGKVNLGRNVTSIIYFLFRL